ncbi:MAG: hypothetical protein EOP48_26995 [Sphingobacteriales bacterium]|nr:MAG: hypothetical protein EOP48_26995 [Sphingobacteriales bacterium]
MTVSAVVEVKLGAEVLWKVALSAVATAVVEFIAGESDVIAMVEVLTEGLVVVVFVNELVVDIAAGLVAFLAIVDTVTEVDALSDIVV